MSRLSGWADLLRTLGAALLGLLRAEIDALREDLGRSGKILLRALLLLALALFVVFWVLGMVAFVGVEVVALWLPRWAAALSVLGALLLVALTLGLVGWWRIRRLERPAATVRRRLENHRDWWERRIAPPVDEADDLD